MSCKLFLRYIFVLIILGIAINLNVLADENLIRNGGMELGEGNPANWGMWGWQMQNATFKLETGAAHGGKRFATIINDVNNDSRFIQEVLVEQGRIYKISGWIKTENVGQGTDVKGASICLLEDSIHSSRDIKGTNGQWEYVEFYLEIDEYVMKVTISLSVGGSRKLNTGKASFDDVEMTEVKIVPQGALMTKITGKPEDIPPTPPQENDKQDPAAEDQTEKSNDTSLQPAPIKSWTSNPLVFVVIFLVIVTIAAVVILLLTPKEEKKDLTGEEPADSHEGEKPADQDKKEEE